MKFYQLCNYRYEWNYIRFRKCGAQQTLKISFCHDKCEGLKQISHSRNAAVVKNLQKTKDNCLNIISANLCVYEVKQGTMTEI